MISSVRNPKIQSVRALQGRAKARREAGAFVVEGVRLAEEALASGWPIRQVFYTEGLEDRGRAAIRILNQRKIPSEQVSEQVMQAISDTETPQGLLLELELQKPTLPEQASLVLILDRLADPGNLGTLLRSAAAAGADAVLLAPGSADAYAPKVLRSGMGAHFRLPVAELSWAEIVEYINQRELYVYLAEAGAELTYDEVDLSNKVALVIGGEAHGLSGAARQLNATAVNIPMPGKIESLNAATAGSLLLFEAVRQRRKKTK